MKRLQLCLILLLAAAAIWINFALYQVATKTPPRLQTQVFTLLPQPVVIANTPAPRPVTVERGQVVLATYVQDTDPTPNMPSFTATPALPKFDHNDYWRQMQTQAEQMIGKDEQNKFLKDSSALLQKLQEAQANLRIDLESVQFLEIKANDEGVEGIIALNTAKKRMAEQMTLIAQYQRDIETLLSPPKTEQGLPKLTNSLTFDVGTPSTRYSHLSADKEIVITQNRNFLVTLHFFFTDNTTEPPQLLSVTDIFNLSTMQSTSKQFFYPDYFTKDIYELVRKMWRAQGVKWNRKPSTEDLQVFLTVLNQ